MKNIMKQNFIVFALLLPVISFGQANFKRVTAINEGFYAIIKADWVPIDTVGKFYREILISQEEGEIQLKMKHENETDEYTYKIEKTNIISNNNIMYYCRDSEKYPLLIEISTTNIWLMYFYDNELKEFQKHEVLKILSVDLK